MYTYGYLPCFYRLHASIERSGALWNDFQEEFLKVFCNNGNIRGQPTPFGAVELVFADFPTDIVVNGTHETSIPEWNLWSDELCESAFAVAESITSDNGFFVTLHGVPHTVKMDAQAREWGMELCERTIVHSATPLGWTCSDPRREVTSCIM